MYPEHGWVIKSYRMLWTIITYPCTKYLTFTHNRGEHMAVANLSQTSRSMTNTMPAKVCNAFSHWTRPEWSRPMREDITLIENGPMPETHTHTSVSNTTVQINDFAQNCGKRNSHSFVLSHRCPNFNADLAQPAWISGHGWVITSHRKLESN